ncbi:MAG: hypothetical protein Ct9H300mP1_30870 [Planctomycetaceae bacterium]|nr:MAG: hypothetical protein Ct9H300mP1_30870 [Planctomycetaceae bacterium]
MQALSPLHWWSQVRLVRWRQTANRIDARSGEWERLDDEELKRYSRELGWKAKSGVALKKLLPDAFGLVREAARRTTGMTPFVVQLMGGMAMFEGGIAEMQTGEGKTLTAVLPTYLRALTGKGCHIVTVNDYLAGRDAEEMGPIYQSLGLTVGCIQTPMEADERRASYACDVTYGTAKEMGFDFLRDQLRQGIARGAIDRHGLLETEPGATPPNPPPSGAPLRTDRRGRQCADRRGPHATDHRDDPAQRSRQRQPVPLVLPHRDTPATRRRLRLRTAPPHRLPDRRRLPANRPDQQALVDQFDRQRTHLPAHRAGPDRPAGLPERPRLRDR